MNENKGAGISPEFYATLGVGPETRQGVAYAEVMKMVQKHCSTAKRALDYGCGAGRSTRFLKQAGLEYVVGVDINEEMLREAEKRQIQGTSYQIIKSGVLPFADNTFELAFSGLVLLEIPKAEEIRKVLTEIARVVTPQGTLMIMTCTKEGNITGADSFEPLITPQQIGTLKDGDPVPTRIKETGQVFNDYFWSDEFLRIEIQKTGLVIVEVSFPTIKKDDKSPFVIYVAKKQ